MRNTGSDAIVNALDDPTSGFIANPWLWAVLALVVGLAAAPWTVFHGDFSNYWLPWAGASQGLHPWAIYQDTYPRVFPPNVYAREACNYPPFVLYLLTLAEAGRQWLNAPLDGWIMRCLVKLPSILAWAGGIPLCAYGLKSIFGRRGALTAAAMWALCLPLFINAAVWGQWDALTGFSLLAVIVAAVNKRPYWLAILLAWALSIKLQSIFIVPALGIWGIRALGWRTMGKVIVATTVFLILMLLPPVLAGEGKPMMQAYTGATDVYPRRTMGASNLWYLVDAFDVKVRHMDLDIAGQDTRPAVGPVTFRQLGLLMVSVCLAWILIMLWRRPTSENLIFAAGLSIVVFFNLATQMHERYLTPGVALLAIIAWRRRALFGAYLAVMGVAAINQLAMLMRDNLWWSLGRELPSNWNTLTTVIMGACAMACIASFLWILWCYWRQTTGASNASLAPSRGEPPLNPPSQA